MNDPTSAPGPADTVAQAEFLGALDVRLDLPLATVGSRAMAQWIDLWMSMGIMVVVLASAATAAILAEVALGDDGVAIVMTVMVLLVFLVQWGYFFFFELFWEGQTPGKRMFGLRVVNLDGSPPGFVGSMVRNLLRILDWIPGTYGIGAITAMLSRRGQRLGDMAAGTVVIREDLVALPTRRTWPAGLGAAEIALLERWARRERTMLPEARASLAAAIVAHLAQAAPGAVPPGPPLEALDHLLAGEG